jgi:hypothetical protein
MASAPAASFSCVVLPFINATNCFTSSGCSVLELIAFDRFDIYPQQPLDNGGNTKYTVSFDRNGGDTAADPAEVTVDAGMSLRALPTPPTRTGYLFTGWN